MIAEAAKFAIGRAALPWLIGVAVMVLSATGVTGMYFGSLIERGRHAGEIQALKDEQLRTVTAQADAFAEAVKRGDDVSNRFFSALGSIQVQNKTFVNEVRHETEKLVYTDCKLPDSGADLLARQVDTANARFIGAAPAQKGKP